MVPAHNHRKLLVIQNFQHCIVHLMDKCFRNFFSFNCVNSMDAIQVDFGIRFHIIKLQVNRCFHNSIRAFVRTLHPRAGFVIWNGNNDYSGSRIIIDYFITSKIHAQKVISPTGLFLCSGSAFFLFLFQSRG